MVEYIKDQGERLGMAELEGKIIAYDRQQARKYKILAAFVYESGYVAWRETGKRTKEVFVGRHK